MKKEKIKDLKNRAISGISTLLVRELLLKFAAVAGQLVLVRIIAPDFFGIYAIVSFIVSLLEFFTDFGVTPAIIQKKVPFHLPKFLHFLF